MYNTYNELMSYALTQKKLRIIDNEHYFEGHHIIPLMENGLGDSKDWNHPNIVPLTLSEHIEAHYLKALEYENKNIDLYFKNLNVCNLMIGKQYTKEQLKTTIEDKTLINLIEKIKQDSMRNIWVQIDVWVPLLVGKQKIEYLKQNISHEQVKRNLQNWKIIENCPICNKSNSRESFACCQEHEIEYIKQLKNLQTKKQSEKLSQIYQNKTEIKKEKLKEAQIKALKGKKWYTNGKESKFISEQKIEQYKKLNWYEGRHFQTRTKLTEEQRKNRIGKVGIGIYIHKDNIVKRIKENELEQYLQDGWIKGSINRDKNKKGRKQTNRTKTIWIHKDSIQQQCSKEELEQYLQDGWNQGRIKLLKSTIEKMKQAKIGKILSEEHKLKISKNCKKPHKDKGLKCWITNNIKNKKILKTELDYYLNNGWKLGRIL
jgi:hypothetical protein